MEELSTAMFRAATVRGDKDLLTVTWYISNLFTSKQASSLEREAA